MGGSFGLDIDEVRRCGEDIGGLQERAGQLRSKVTDAEVPEVSWGLLGMASAYAGYRVMLGTLTDHLGTLTEGLGHAGEALHRTVELYDSADDAVRARLEQIDSELPPPDAGLDTWVD